jgi:hypothetical protein
MQKGTIGEKGRRHMDERYHLVLQLDVISDVVKEHKGIIVKAA